MMYKGNRLPYMVPFFFFPLSTLPVPNTSHPIIPVEATFLRKAKSVSEGRGMVEQSKRT